MGANVSQLQSMVTNCKSQTEWKGWIIWAFFLGGLGSGLYTLSVILGFTPGMIFGLLIVLIGKNACHIIFLGRPERFWRAASRPRTAWISRGFIGITLFCISGALYLIPMVSSLKWGNGFNQFLIVFSIFCALWVMIYTGFVMATSRAIPAWNNAVIPVIYVIFGFMGGMDIILIWSGLGAAELESIAKYLELIQLGFFALGILLVSGYLLLLNNTSQTTKSAFKILTTGKYSVVFIAGVLLGGLLLPGVLVGVSYFVSTAAWLTVLAGVFALTGSFLLRWTLFKVGMYTPLL